MKLCGVSILTDNVPCLRDFYKKILRCDCIGDDTHAGFDEAQLAIWNPGNVKITEQKNMLLMYFVDDADEEYERLKTLDIGVRFQSEPTIQPWGVKAFAFYDPDGNEINFLAPIRK